MRSRLPAALTAIGVAVTIAVATIAVATPASAVSTNHTLAQTEAKLRGMSVGPNSYTAWGQATINGTWTSYLDCNNKKHYVPKLTITNHNPTLTNPTLTDTVTSPSGDATCTPGIVPVPAFNSADADSWYNPLSWNWGSIFGAIWSPISKCLSHAMTGSMGMIATDTTTKLLAMGSALEVTPEGMVLVAVGACWASIGW